MRFVNSPALRQCTDLCWCIIVTCMLWPTVCGTLSAQTYHSPPSQVHPLMQDQDQTQILSILRRDDGTLVSSAKEWNQQHRPKLLSQWTRVLGKLQPEENDIQWFGDVTQTVEVSRQQKKGYTRVELQLPIETDFLQPHLLLIPDNAADHNCPAVIAWTSTSPDFRKPEDWWGAWLARRGFVVLTGWSHIRNYRKDSSYRNGVNEVCYQRFGRWLPMAKMVHDVQREVEYLRTVPAVDGSRVGFMGFSLSAKSALYVAAFAPEIRATVAIDPHLAIYGASNYLDPWYLDARRRFDDIKTDTYPDPELRGTVWSLLDTDPTRPGFERNHHELMALAAPRALMVIGCSTDKQSAVHSDDRQSGAYVDRAKEVYQLLEVPDQLEYVPLSCGHQADGPEINRAWQRFFERTLLQTAGGVR